MVSPDISPVSAHDVYSLERKVRERASCLAGFRHQTSPYTNIWKNMTKLQTQKWSARHFTRTHARTHRYKVSPSLTPHIPSISSTSEFHVTLQPSPDSQPELLSDRATGNLAPLSILYHRRSEEGHYLEQIGLDRHTCTQKYVWDHLQLLALRKQF